MTEQLEQMVFDDFIEYLIINGTGDIEEIAQQQSK